MTLWGEKPSLFGANFYLRVLLEVVTPAHSLDAALSVHNSLLARVERVAVATNFYAQHRLGAARFKYVAARARYR